MTAEAATSRGSTALNLAGEAGGRNVELKARDPAPATTLEVCRRLGAVDCGVLWQRDTYFNTPQGRLKLREQRPGRSQLIHYQRPDQAEERESRYRILEVTDAETIRGFLAESLGVRATITKQRRLLLWRSVRIHLDEVEGHGPFIEFEAVAQPDSDLSAEHELIAQLRTSLGIVASDLVGASYADLAASARAPGADAHPGAEPGTEAHP